MQPTIYHDRNGIDVPARFCSHWKLFAIGTQITIALIGDYQPNRANLLWLSFVPYKLVPLFPLTSLLLLFLLFLHFLVEILRSIQLSAIWNVEVGQRVSPFTLAIIIVACHRCCCNLNGNKSDWRKAMLRLFYIILREICCKLLKYGLCTVHVRYSIWALAMSSSSLEIGSKILDSYFL